MTQAVATRGQYRPPSPSQVAAVVEAMARGLTLSAACAEARCSYTTLRSRIERDEQLAEQIDAAKARFHTLVIDEITRRAITGVERTIFHGGEPCGVETRYSDRLLIRLADAIPEFNPARKVEHEHSGTITHQAAPPSISPELLRTLAPEHNIAVRRAVVEDAFKRAAIDADKRLDALSHIIADAEEWGVPVDLATFAALPAPEIVDASYEEVPASDDPTDEEINSLF